jgi:hypothetical protein
MGRFGRRIHRTRGWSSGAPGDAWKRTTDEPPGALWTVVVSSVPTTTMRSVDDDDDDDMDDDLVMKSFLMRCITRRGTG